MKTFTGSGLGRVLVISLGAGDKMLESVRQGVRDAGIRDGVVISGIGTLSHVHYHRVATLTADPVDEFLTSQGPMEVAAIDGLIVNYEPHLHFTFSGLQQTVAGHLEDDCTVLYLAEIVVAEVHDLNLVRYRGEHRIPQLKARG
jgi:predicted DNA-binding protein with PD1-like motif